MFLAEVTAVQVDDSYMDDNGKFMLNNTGLIAYSHGEYLSLGEKLGQFGYSVRKKKKQTKKKEDTKTVPKDNSTSNSYQNDDSIKNRTEDPTGGEYIIADSATRLLTTSDIQGLTARELNYAKNEIYARHGRKFDSQELRNYFESKSWYVEKYDGSVFDTNYSDQLLSNIEKKNAEFLKDAENRAQNGGYQLDQ